MYLLLLYKSKNLRHLFIITSQSYSCFAHNIIIKGHCYPFFLQNNIFFLIPTLQPNKNFIFSYIYCYCILISYSLYTQVMLILILIDVQCFQNIIFSSEKGSNRQSHSSADSHQPIKKSPQQNFPLPPLGGRFPHTTFYAFRKNLKNRCVKAAIRDTSRKLAI